jgi:hypothetical protein
MAGKIALVRVGTAPGIDEDGISAGKSRIVDFN